jgi:hypothetical protein
LVFELTRTEVAKDASVEVFRIGITDRHSKEFEAVVSVTAADSDLLAKTMVDLEALLERIGVAERPALSLAALAAVSKVFLSRLGRATGATGIEALTHHDRI